MGTVVSAVHREGDTHSQTTMIQFSLLLCATSTVLASPVADPKAFGVGYGHVSPCVTEPDTIPVSACRLEPEKVCTTETIVVVRRLLDMRIQSVRKSRDALLISDIMARERLRLRPSLRLVSSDMLWDIMAV